MSYDLRLRFTFANDEIWVDFQRNIDKLSSAIRTRSIIENAKLTYDEQELLVFLQQINGKKPPFFIPKEFFCDVLFDRILNINFFFIQKPNKGLKRIYSLPFTASHYDFATLKPTNIKIYIKTIQKNNAKVESYLDFDGIEVPLWYEFLIAREKSLFAIDKTEIINKANAIVDDIFKTQFNYEELNALNADFRVLVKSDNHHSKSASFSQKPSGFLSFDKNVVYDTEFYSRLLESYLKNKNYIEFNNEILFFKESDISEKAALQMIQEANIENADIVGFLEKIKNIKQYSFTNILEIIEPKIKYTLKDYQVEGVLWLCNLYKNNVWGGLLADDMGLGKTLQTICFLSVNDIQKILIIAPASLVQNWKNEILKFTYIKESEISLSLQHAKIQILSYENARAKLSSLGDYEVLIIDESQKIKNHKTQIFNAITQIQRNFTIILSGTPIENSLLDLWSMMSAINNNFRWIYDNKIAPFMNDVQTAINLSVKILSPFIKRREKEQVLNLPTRETRIVFVDFNVSEKESYEKIYKIFVSALKSRLSARANFVMLEGLLRLRQFCSLHKVIPDTLCNCQNLEDSKLKTLLELVHNILERREKVIIFSQFTKSLEILKTALNGVKFLYLDGSVTKDNRAKLIEEFQAKDSPFDVFLISLKAGGVGLNLTNAQHAIILEPWFNPAVEEQAFSRIHRIGQHKKVCVYKLLYSNSIESQIHNLINHKLGISQGLNGELLKVAKSLFELKNIKV